MFKNQFYLDQIMNLRRRIMNKIISVIFGFLLVLSFTTTSYSRDQIKIVGSSTVYPYATVVAEKSGKSGKFKTPVISHTFI